PMTRSPDAAAVCALEASTAAALSQFEDPGAALSLLAGIGVARSLCAPGATAIAATAIAAMVSVRRQWARLQSAQLRRGPTTAAAAATTPTATGFARTTERRDAPRVCVFEADESDGHGLPPEEQANDQSHRHCARAVRCVLRTEYAVRPTSAA